MSIEKEFVPYEESLALQELGFHEPCFAKYDFKKSLNPISWNMVWCENTLVNEIYAPTFSQAFRWFRDNHGYSHSITEHEIIEGQTDLLYVDESEEFQGIEWLARVQPHFIETFKSYEKAELACLKKLIEIVQGGNK